MVTAHEVATVTISAHEVSQVKSIYVVHGGPKHVKIGIASDVKRRIAGIQTGCPYRVGLVKSWLTPNARIIEKRAHRAFGKYQSAGEWFTLPTKVAMTGVAALVRCHPRSNELREYSLGNPTLVFCSYCANCRTFPAVPEFSARFRCTKCNRTEHVHVVEM